MCAGLLHDVLTTARTTLLRRSAPPPRGMAQQQRAAGAPTPSPPLDEGSVADFLLKKKYFLSALELHQELQEGNNGMHSVGALNKFFNDGNTYASLVKRVADEEAKNQVQCTYRPWWERCAVEGRAVGCRELCRARGAAQSLRVVVCVWGQGAQASTAPSPTRTPPQAVAPTLRLHGTLTPLPSPQHLAGKLRPSSPPSRRTGCSPHSQRVTRRLRFWSTACAARRRKVSGREGHC